MAVTGVIEMTICFDPSVNATALWTAPVLWRFAACDKTGLALSEIESAKGLAQSRTLRFLGT
jgi:hypothetical protein